MQRRKREQARQAAVERADRERRIKAQIQSVQREQARQQALYNAQVRAYKQLVEKQRRAQEVEEGLGGRAQRRASTEQDCGQHRSGGCANQVPGRSHAPRKMADTLGRPPSYQYRPAFKIRFSGTGRSAHADTVAIGVDEQRVGKGHGHHPALAEVPGRR